MHFVRCLLLSSCLLGTLACRKEVEKIVVQQVPVDRQYSWSPSKQLLGNFNILLGVGKGPGGLYFQQPTGLPVGAAFAAPALCADPSMAAAIL